MTRQASERGPGSSLHTALSEAEVRSRAASGAIQVTVRTVFIRAIALASNIVVAHLLAPAQLGTVAFGSTLLTAALLLSDAGLGAGLIRAAEPVQLEQLRSLLGLQLCVGFAVSLGGAALSYSHGQTGAVTAVMLAGLPLAAVRTPGTIVLERALRYGPLMRVEMAETVAQYGLGVALVACGLGPMGLALGWIARLILGAILMPVSSNVGFLYPSLDFRRIRDLIRFGAAYQVNTIAGLVRDQGTNVSVAALGSLTLLGIWDLAYKILTVPFLLFGPLWRVSYPTLSRLRGLGTDVTRLVQDWLPVLTVATGLILVPLAVTSRALVTSVFGPAWTPAAVIISLASLAVLISGPISVGTAGLLFSAGHARAVSIASVGSAAVWLTAVALLTRPLGAGALGVGVAFGSLMEAWLLARAASRAAGLRLHSMWRPVAVCLIVGGLGYALCQGLPATFTNLVIEVVASEAALVLAFLAVCRPALLRGCDAIRRLRRNVHELASQAPTVPRDHSAQSP